MSDTITVKSKKELAELLMSGGEWEAQDGYSVCFYSDTGKFDNPFRAKFKNIHETFDMKISWEYTHWRKAKYQPKHNEVVLAWDDNVKDAVLGVFGSVGIKSEIEPEGRYSNYAPYIGTIPPNIQKFLDELESR